ncbi:hypothetical protein BC829DRAFT_63712 [Chytridium lagenaria]|nr:hypothetical protein BC829DRAFT_63712 [Chytridium lagenaria]
MPSTGHSTPPEIWSFIAVHLHPHTVAGELARVNRKLRQIFHTPSISFALRNLKNTLRHRCLAGSLNLKLLGPSYTAALLLLHEFAIDWASLFLRGSKKLTEVYPVCKRILEAIDYNNTYEGWKTTVIPNPSHMELLKGAAALFAKEMKECFENPNALYFLALIGAWELLQDQLSHSSTLSLKSSPAFNGIVNLACLSGNVGVLSALVALNPETFHASGGLFEDPRYFSIESSSQFAAIYQP